MSYTLLLHHRSRMRLLACAAWGALRDMSRESTTEWVQQMESRTIREAVR